MTPYWTGMVFAFAAAISWTLVVTDRPGWAGAAVFWTLVAVHHFVRAAIQLDRETAEKEHR